MLPRDHGRRWDNLSISSPFSIEVRVGDLWHIWISASVDQVVRSIPSERTEACGLVTLAGARRSEDSLTNDEQAAEGTTAATLLADDVGNRPFRRWPVPVTGDWAG